MNKHTNGRVNVLVIFSVWEGSDLSSAVCVPRRGCRWACVSVTKCQRSCFGSLSPIGTHSTKYQLLLCSLAPASPVQCLYLPLWCAAFQLDIPSFLPSAHLFRLVPDSSITPILVPLFLPVPAVLSAHPSPRTASYLTPQLLLPTLMTTVPCPHCPCHFVETLPC